MLSSIGFLQICVNHTHGTAKYQVLQMRLRREQALIVRSMRWWQQELAAVPRSSKQAQNWQRRQQKV